MKTGARAIPTALTYDWWLGREVRKWRRRVHARAHDCSAWSGNFSREPETAVGEKEM